MSYVNLRLRQFAQECCQCYLHLNICLQQYIGQGIKLCNNYCGMEFCPFWIPLIRSTKVMLLLSKHSQLFLFIPTIGPYLKIVFSCLHCLLTFYLFGLFVKEIKPNH